MESAIDKNGMTEAQFLKEYDVSRYFRPSVTVDAVLLRVCGEKGRILLVERGGHPFIGKWAFPGGFVEKDESCETAVVRELCEETGIVGVPLRQAAAVSTPCRDPRWRNITVVFYAEPESDVNAVGGDDAAKAEWFDFSVSADGKRVRLSLDSESASFTETLDAERDAFGDVDINKTKITERGGMAFDHAKIVYYLFDKIKRGIR